MKKLDVLGRKVSVKIKRIKDMPDVAGTYDHSSGVITISPDCPQKFHTLCHELAHAYFERSGLFQGIRNQPIEEIFCETLATVLEHNIVTLYQMHKKLSR